MSQSTRRAQVEMSRSYYSAPASEIAASAPASILGILTRELPFALKRTQRAAWLAEIAHLIQIAPQFPEAHFFLEFVIPRMGRRADVIILWRGVVFVIEYKVGASRYPPGAIDQVVGYALDLKHFHETSHECWIVPVLVATKGNAEPFTVSWSDDHVAAPVCATPRTLPDVLDAFGRPDAPAIDPSAWSAGRYKPTPTIIEAAQALYQNHSVEAISRNEAGAENLSTTADYIGSVIDQAKAMRRKVICFVTGVPGSGKTLAGLNITSQRMRHEEENAIFLSGNGPLVSVLREALTQDALARARENGAPSTRDDEFDKAAHFIQNIHHFRDDALRTARPLVPRVVVFDEAQRAWDLKQTCKFMREKRGQEDFKQSESEFFLSAMDRNPDWCVVICLVGGGQEINTGEAGLVAWLEALSTQFPHWDVHYPSQVLGKEYISQSAIAGLDACQRAVRASGLHLAVSIRSFRAEKLSQFVGALIDHNAAEARAVFPELHDYPLFLTRDLNAARLWLRSKRRGTERSGLLASSNALRLKWNGIFVKAKIDPTEWFLKPNRDVRASNALEDTGTEFDVQGLDLDWTCVGWDANLRVGESGWDTFRFKAGRWEKMRIPDRRSFLLNSYRVLLTRARQGMVIFVPPGDPQDATRSPGMYDPIARFLQDCGVPLLDAR